MYDYNDISKSHKSQRTFQKRIVMKRGTKRSRLILQSSSRKSEERRNRTYSGHLGHLQSPFTALQRTYFGYGMELSVGKTGDSHFCLLEGLTKYHSQHIRMELGRIWRRNQSLSVCASHGCPDIPVSIR